MGISFEDFCRSNLLHVILKNHNEGTSRNVEELSRMIYDEYMTCPQLRHLDSYYLNELRFYPPKLSSQEQILADQHQLTDCYVDMQKENWCLKTDRYLLNKLKRTDKRDDVLIVNSKMYVRNQKVILFKYVRNKLRMEREKQLKEKREFLTQLDVNIISPVHPVKSTSRKSMITDFFAKHQKGMSPQKKKTKDRLLNTPDRDMYSSLSDSDQNRSMVSSTSQDSIVTVIEMPTQKRSENELLSIYANLKPCPASKKKILLKSYATTNQTPKEIENTRPDENIIAAQGAPKIIEIVHLPKNLPIEVMQTGVPIINLPSAYTNDLLDHQLKKRGLRVKPGPKSMKEKVLEKAKRLENTDNLLNIKACPASKKRKHLAEYFETQQEVLEKVKEMVKPISPVKRRKPTPAALPLRRIDAPPSVPLEPIGSTKLPPKIPNSHLNPEKGSKLWLLLHGVYDEEKGIFVAPPEVEATCPVQTMSPMEGCSKWVSTVPTSSKIAPQSPQPTQDFLPISQVDLVQDVESIINLVLEKNARHVLHPKLFHFPELLKKVKEIVLKKAILYEEKNRNPLANLIGTTPPKRRTNQSTEIIHEKNPKETEETSKVIGNCHPIPSPILVKSRLEKRLEEITSPNAKIAEEQAKPVVPAITKENKFSRRSAPGPLSSKISYKEGDMEIINSIRPAEEPVTPGKNSEIQLAQDPSLIQIPNVEPELILCDQLETQSQLYFAEPLANPLDTQENLLISSSDMQVDSEIEISTAPDEIIEIHDDSCILDDIIKDSPSPVKQSPMKQVAEIPRHSTINRSDLAVTEDQSSAIGPSSPKKTAGMESNIPMICTPTTRSKTVTSRISMNNGEFGSGTASAQCTKLENSADQGEVAISERRTSPRIKVAFRYNALPLQHKGPEVKEMGGTTKRKRGRPKKLPGAEDIYTKVRFEEKSKGFAADLNIEDTSSLSMDEAEEESGAPTEPMSTHRPPITEQVKKFMAEAERLNDGTSANSFSYSKITKLVHERDDKGNFYSDCCPRCDLTVDFTVNGMRNLRFDMDINRYLLHLTENQWTSFMNLLQRVEKFEYTTLAKDQQEQSCCVIKRVLTVLLKMTPKLGVNTGVIRSSTGVGARPIYLRRPPDDSFPSLDLTQCINTEILGRLEDLVTQRRLGK